MPKRQPNWSLRILFLVMAIVVVAAVGVNVFGQTRMVRVCNNDPYNPYYGKIITVRESEQSHYAPVDDPACDKR